MQIGTIILVGVGRMGGAMLEQWQKEPALKIVVMEKNQAVRSIDFSALQKPVLLVLAVKPQTLAEVLPEYAANKAHIDAVITIAAGKKNAFYEGYFGTQMPIYRAMPNLPVVVGLGCTYIVENDAAHQTKKAYGDYLFGLLGSTQTAYGNEDKMNAFTAVAGSGPAYLFAVMEAWIQAAEKQGFTRAQAEDIVRQTVAGSVALHKKLNQPEVALINQVASKGGTTEAALKVFAQDNQLNRLFSQAIAAAIKRAEELE